MTGRNEMDRQMRINSGRQIVNISTIISLLLEPVRRGGDLRLLFKPPK